MRRDESSEKLIDLLDNFIVICKKQCDRNENRYLLSFLNKSRSKMLHQQQNAIDEARTIYQNVNTICLASHIKLTADEQKILKEINTLSTKKGIWGGLNTLNTTNTWPGV